MNPITRYRIWCCNRDEAVAITPLNTVSQWDAPGTTGRQTRLFHWFLKRPIRRIARSIRVPQLWIDGLTGNWKVAHEILKETYLDNEKQARRAGLLWPLVEAGLCYLAYDNNYDEVGQAGLAAILRNRDRFVFDAHKINPENWYADNRGRIEVEQSAEAFRVISQTERDLVVSGPLNGRILTTFTKDGQGRPCYLAIDLDGQDEPWPGVFVYPILASGPSVLDIAPNLLAVPA